MRRFLVIIVVGGLCIAEGRAADTGARYSLSIYSAGSNNGEGLFSTGSPENGAPCGYAIVRDRRQFDLKNGQNSIIVRDVSRYLDAGALTARAVDDAAGTQILSQRFDDETVSLEALVLRHLGRPVEVQIAGGNGTPQAVISGTLLSNAGGLIVLQPDGRVSTIPEFSRVIFPDLPRGLAATASLRWDIAAKKAGLQNFEIVYPTQGLAWRAEYGGWLASGECRLELSGWAQIANRTGTDFPDAHVKLVAGEPHHAANAFPAGAMMARTVPAAAAPAGNGGVVGDYHEYTLDGAIDVGSGSLLRAALFPAQTIACQRQYLFEGSHMRANAGMAPITERNYGNEAPSPIHSTLTFKSERALPAGRLRILQNASDGAPEFTGEDDIGHTPRGEATTIQLGNAFDLRGERRQSEFTLDKDHRTLGESFAIRLSNGGASAQTVVIREHLYRWTQWAVTQSSAKYAKRDADTIDFGVDVPANGNVALTYSVQYQWSESLK